MSAIPPLATHPTVGAPPPARARHAHPAVASPDPLADDDGRAGRTARPGRGRGAGRGEGGGVLRDADPAAAGGAMLEVPRGGEAVVGPAARLARRGAEGGRQWAGGRAGQAGGERAPDGRPPRGRAVKDAAEGGEA